MRIILEDKQSHQYLTAANTWTVDRTQAETFELVSEAVHFALAADQPNLHVLLDFGESRYDIRVPVAKWKESLSATPQALTAASA